MKLSITIVSFGKYFNEGKMDIKGFITYCGNLGIEGVDLGYYWKNEEGIKKVPRWLKENNLNLGCYIVSNDFALPNEKDRQKEVEKVKYSIDIAVELGVDIVRVFGGNVKEGITYDTAKEWIVDSLRETASYAGKHNITLALENHGQLCGESSQIIDIVNSVDSSYLKVNIDIANFLCVDEDPLEGVTELSPYMIYAHVKDFKEVNEEYKDGDVIISSGGKRYVGSVAGEGIIDLEGAFKRLKEANYTGYLSLEYEAQEDNKIGVKRSITNIKKILRKVGGRDDRYSYSPGKVN